MRPTSTAKHRERTFDGMRSCVWEILINFWCVFVFSLCIRYITVQFFLCEFAFFSEGVNKKKISNMLVTKIDGNFFVCLFLFFSFVLFDFFFTHTHFVINNWFLYSLSFYILYSDYWMLSNIIIKVEIAKVMCFLVTRQKVAW